MLLLARDRGRAAERIAYGDQRIVAIEAYRRQRIITALLRQVTVLH